MQTQSPTFIKLNGKKRESSRFTQEEKLNHLKAWRESGLSMSEYSRKNGISLPSLSKWLKQAKEQTDPAKKTELTILSRHLLVHEKLEIILRNGIRLKLSETWSLDETIKFIKALE